MVVVAMLMIAAVVLLRNRRFASGLKPSGEARWLSWWPGRRRSGRPIPCA